jgi:hypothetical protein
MNKTVAIHQPNYLPWIGYFYKILNCDYFVFLDNVQYEKNSFINRNLIKTANGVQWLTVGVLTKGAKDQLINDVKINNSLSWNDSHWKSLTQNYGKCRYFQAYAEELENIYRVKWDSLAELNESLISFCCKALNIENVNFIKASSLNASGKSTDLLANICLALGGNTYFSGNGGAKYIVERKFEEAQIVVKYSDFQHPSYFQKWGEFVPNLTILDLLFNEGEQSASIIRNSHKIA